MTKILKLNVDSFDDSELAEAGECIRRGGLVCFPTETVYGLGANALDSAACDSVFEAKGRPHDNPLIVHILDPHDASFYAETEIFPSYFELAERFMPGPLTVILPKKNVIPDSVTVGLNTVALRCPSHPIARALIRAADRPIAAPSANLSGRPSPTTASDVVEDMLGRVDMILDGGDCDVGLESTVISLTSDGVCILRPGYVTEKDLLQVCDHVTVSDAVLRALNSDEKAESPGMKYRHYAPKAPVTMVVGSDGDVCRFFERKEAEGCGILCFDEDLVFLKGRCSSRVVSLGSKCDVRSQAARLFSALRSFDRMELKQIYARSTDREDFGLAVTNRLLRACAFQILEL